MDLFSTKQIADATGMKVRQIQHYTEKRVIQPEGKSKGRGNSLKFSHTDIIRFLMINEMTKYGMGIEKMQSLIREFFKRAREKADIKSYIKNKLYLEGRHFIFICEYPQKGEYEDVFGHLIYDPNNPGVMSDCYFQQPLDRSMSPGFYGYKFEKHSRSALFLDMENIYKECHDYLTKHYSPNDINLLESDIATRTKTKGE